MKVNMDFYKEKEESLSQKEKDVIEISLSNKSYNEIIEESPTVNNYIHLSSVKENLLSWYEFKKNSSLLEIGSRLGELSSLFLKKLSKIVLTEESLERIEVLKKKLENSENTEIIAGDFSDINLEDKFDYIVITDYLENHDLSVTLSKAKAYLKDKGTIFVAINNKYGIKNWKGKDDYKALLDSKAKLTKKYLEDDLNKLGLGNYKFYYIFPEYKAPNLIYSDDYQISMEDISRNFELNEHYEDVGFKENNVLENLFRDEENIINFFANSFLIEISDSDLSNARYITFTNYRKFDKQIQTIITSDKVIKRAVNSKAEKHIKEMLENGKHFPKNGCVLIDKKKDDVTVESDFISGKRLDQIIEKSADPIAEFDKYKNFLYEANQKVSYDELDKEKLIEPLRDFDKKTLKDFTYLKFGYIDMIPKNCFVVGGVNFFFDQEWMIKNIPFEFVLKRAIDNTYLPQNIKEELFEKYDLNKDKEVFDKIEGWFLDKLIDRTVLTQILQRPPLLKNEKVKILNNEIESLRDNVKTLNNQISSQSAEITNLQNENEKLELEVQDRDKQLVIIANSFSWKITKPLRWISGKVRALISKLKKGENN